MPDLPALVGLTIAAAEESDDGHLWLRFTDNTVLEVEGLGYDGLWDSVVWTWHEKKENGAK